MSAVESLLGPLAVDALGVTYIHEHVFILSPELQWYWPGYAGWDEEAAVARGRTELTRIHTEYGCDTVVDVTVPGIGRNLRAVARAAAGTGVNVIAATGWYIYDQLPFVLSKKPEAEKIALLTDLFVGEAREGIEGTRWRPGLIKCATDAGGVSADVEAVLRACARAHLETGLPLTTHTYAAARVGLDQQRVFREEGVALDRVIIGHSNEAADLDYLTELMDAGSFVGFDRLGYPPPQRDGVAAAEAQLDNLAALIGRGYGDRLVVSHDDAVFSDVRSREVLGRTDEIYGYVHETALPGLRERGVGEAEIRALLVDNPRRYFAGA
jgi:phosphotriesterase-related protein